MLRSSILYLLLGEVDEPATLRSGE